MHFQVFCGDFAESLAQIDNNADLCLMSPPYADARTYDISCVWTMPDYMRLGESVYKALKPGGTCIMVLDAPIRNWREGKGTERGLLPWHVMLDWAERIGFRVPDRLAYGRLGSPGAYAGRFRNDWEPCFWFEKPGARSYFDKACMDKPGGVFNVPKTITSRRSDGSTYRRISSGEAIESQVKRQGTYLDYGNVGANHDLKELYTSGHPARFCSKFAEDMIRCFCPIGGIVTDPFVGSGTTAFMSLKTGRSFIGGDIQQKWVDRTIEICTPVLEQILYPF